MKKQSLILMLGLVISLVFCSCSSGTVSDSTNSSSEVSVTPRLTSSDVMLPFKENAQLVWKASDISDANVEYKKESEEYKARVADISKKEKVQAFINILNETNQKLVGAVKQTQDDYKQPFAQFDLGTEIYFFRMNSPNYTLMIVYKTDDCGYIWFRQMDDIYYHYSLYSVNLDNLQKLEQFFEELDKRWEPLSGKPVLYLYPEHEMDVNVRLTYNGRLTTTYPAYNGGWNVHAYPDGHLINNADKLEYSYLFWEGFAKSPNWDLSEGYCVAGTDIASFLQQTLSKLGLTAKEYNEFIVYWLPQLEANPYNLITFQWEEYEKLAPLTITPTPDSVLRVFMVFAPLNKPINIKAPEERKTFVRHGFTVVEWGASKTESDKRFIN